MVIDIFSLLTARVLDHKGVGVGGNVLGSEGSFKMQRQLVIDAQGHDLRRVTSHATRGDTKDKFLLPFLLAAGLQDPKLSAQVSRMSHVDDDDDAAKIARQRLR